MTLNKNENRNINDSSKGTSNLQALSDASKLLVKTADILREIANGFDQTVGKVKDVSSDGLSDLSKMYDRVTRNEEEMRLSTGQKIAQTFSKTFSAVFTYVFDKFKTGFTSIVDNYNQNLHAITSRMQKTNSQYSEMLLEHTKMIEQDNLKHQFSQIDWSDALIPVLEQGIRGGMAENMAYQNMITNRLLPMLSTNTREYTRMSKLFGKTFTEGITAISTYSERLLDSAEGLEEHNLDDIITTVYREVQEQVRLKGGSKEDVTSAMEEIILNYQAAAKAYGSQSAMEMLQGYAKVLNRSAITGQSDLLGVIGNTNSFGDYTNLYRNFAKGNLGVLPSGFAAEAFSSLGFSQTLVQDILNNEYFDSQLESTDDMLSAFNASAEMQGDIYRLQQGYYRSITEQQDKFNENLMAELGTWSAEYIPHSIETIEAIMNLISSWFAIWMAKGTIDSFTNALGGKGGGLRGIGRGSGGIGGKEVISGPVLTSNAGTMALGLGETAVGAYGAYYGVTKGIIEGHKDLKDKTLYNANEVGTAKIVGGTAAAAGGATLAGVGIATTMAGAAGLSASVPVVGWIAAAVLAVGAATIMIAENTKQVNSFAASIESMREPLKKSVRNYTNGLKDQLATIRSLTDEENKITELAKLLNIDPDTSFLKDVSKESEEDVTSLVKTLSAATTKVENDAQEYVNLLVDQTQTEYGASLKQQEFLKDLINSFDWSSGKLSGEEAERFRDMVDDLSKLMPSARGKLAQEAVDAAISGKGLFNVKGLSYGEAAAILGIEGRGGWTAFWSQYIAERNSVARNLVNFTELPTVVYKYLSDHEVTDYLSKPEAFEVWKALQETGDALGLLSGFAKQYKETENKYSKEAYYDLYKQVWDDRGLDTYNLEEIAKHKPSDSYTGQAEKDVPGFRLGALSIPQDGLPALLHQGEMVLPAAMAETLRQVSGAHSISGVGSFLTNLFSLSQVIPVASSTSDIEIVDQISSIITIQTETLSNLLESILSKVGGIHSILDGESRRSSTTPEPIPYAVKYYQGVPY